MATPLARSVAVFVATPQRLAGSVFTTDGSQFLISTVRSDPRRSRSVPEQSLTCGSADAVIARRTGKTAGWIERRMSPLILRPRTATQGDKSRHDVALPEMSSPIGPGIDAAAGHRHLPRPQSVAR